ncbi:MAG TPA: hypothetical protein VEC57_06090 [Candidatus Limnocylindrales bacterium]|nr:hypothetical protein [Candidatus Limnocylindrales bacterium]
MNEDIQVGYHAFTKDGTEEFGAIRGIDPERRRLTVYVENAGDFDVSADAVAQVGYQKVMFDCDKLDPELREAIVHAHDAELANDAAIVDYNRDEGDDGDPSDAEKLEILDDLETIASNGLRNERRS